MTNDFAGVTFSITVRPRQSITDVDVDPGAQLSSATTSKGRRAAVLKNDEGEGSCDTMIAVGSGRIDINAASTRAKTEDMCSVGSKISDFVEPRLPAA